MGEGQGTANKNIGFLLVLLASVLYGIMPALTQRAYAAGVTVESVLTGRYLIGTALILVAVFNGNGYVVANREFP